MHLSRRHFLAGFGLAASSQLLAQPSDRLEVPFVPTPSGLAERMLDLAGLTARDYLIDLGCGDGRIPVAAGRRGARALGVDLDPERLRQANAEARSAGVTDRVHFRRQDLFETPIHEASVIALYLLPAVNLRLRPKLLTELPAGARVVSHAFDMGDWAADDRQEHDGRRIFLWHVPAVAGGSWELSGGGGAGRLLELEQRYQMVSGTISGGGTARPVTGRLNGRALSLASADGTLRLEGQVGDNSIAASDGSWQAARLN